MKRTKTLHDLGQSLWLDNFNRQLLNSGTLQRYIDDLSVTGLTSNPTIFDHAIKNSSAYDAAIRKKLKEGKSGEGLFFRANAPSSVTPEKPRTCGTHSFADPYPLVLMQQVLMDFDAFALADPRLT